MNKEIKDRSVSQPIMSVHELLSLGGGEVAYIKELSADEAERMFPAIENLPRGISLFALTAADGTPILVTDNLGAAAAQARSDDLEIQRVH
ncbi:MAG: DUF1150 family protein [Hyphomicrobiaceae bacterium]|jgi:hypothetical protein